MLYRITDAEGATAIGVARVPGLENQAPTLSDIGRDATNRVIEAAAPAPLTILLADIVEDPDGDPDIKLTDTELTSPGDRRGHAPRRRQRIRLHPADGTVDVGDGVDRVRGHRSSGTDARGAPASDLQLSLVR